MDVGRAGGGLDGAGVTCEDVGMGSEGGWWVVPLEDIVATLVDSEDPATS